MTTVVGITITLVLATICTATWLTFDEETRDRFTFFQRATLVFFGLLFVVLMHALVRSRAVAYPDRLVIARTAADVRRAARVVRSRAERTGLRERGEGAG